MPRVRGELDVSTEVLLEGPELVLKDPTSSLTGRALSGMLAAQVALQVSMPLIISSSSSSNGDMDGNLCDQSAYSNFEVPKQLTFDCVQLVLIHEHSQNILP